MKKVILDTDPGIDDAQAIAYAIAHPDIELLGLTTVFGNALIDITTRNAVWLLEKFGRGDIPVARGAAHPLVQEPLPPADFVHGKNGLGELEITPPIGSPIDKSAAQFIVDSVNASPGEITLVAVGPLTNIAAAMALDTNLSTKVKELIVMGGSVEEPGNVTPVAEANFFNDPHAADQVFAGDWPAVIVGLDVTHQVLLMDSHLARLRDNAGVTGQILWESSRFYVNFYSTHGVARDRDEPACAMHDATALVFLNERDAFELRAGGCRVAVDGVAAGQLILDYKGLEYKVPHWRSRPRVHAAMAVDAERVREAFLDTIIDHKLS